MSLSELCNICDRIKDRQEEIKELVKQLESNYYQQQQNQQQQQQQQEQRAKSTIVVSNCPQMYANYTASQQWQSDICKHCSMSIFSNALSLRCHHQYHFDCLKQLIQAQVESHQELHCICNMKIDKDELASLGIRNIANQRLHSIFSDEKNSQRSPTRILVTQRIPTSPNEEIFRSIEYYCSNCSLPIMGDNVTLNCNHCFHQECFDKLIDEQLRSYKIPKCKCCGFQIKLMDLSYNKKQMNRLAELQLAALMEQLQKKGWIKQDCYKCGFKWVSKYPSQRQYSCPQDK